MKAARRRREGRRGAELLLDARDRRVGIVAPVSDDFPRPLPVGSGIACGLSPAHRCPRCHDTGRVVMLSAWYPGRTTEGFCPDGTPLIDPTTGRYHRPAA